MGFYGEIQLSNKTSYQFDKTYANRKAMDYNPNGDGVFLGRYVRVEYNDEKAESPNIITAHYKKNTSGKVLFYKNPDFTNEYPPASYSNVIMKVANIGALDTDSKGYKYPFYIVKKGEWVALSVANDLSSYTTNYLIDALEYKEGYDSTVWMKQYDIQNNTYKYVHVADLNAPVPEFELIVNPPEQYYQTPYFDSDSTNLKYYLATGAPMIDVIRKVENGNSDGGTISRHLPKWTYNNGIEKYEGQTSDITPDIYYNAAGFNKNERTKHSGTQVNGHNLGIGYLEKSSGRHYGQDKALTNVNDMRAWYIALPQIGNAICEMWDTLATTDRKWGFSDKKNDSSSDVTYDTESLMGLMNQTRDTLGYILKEMTGKVGDTKTTVDNNLYYDSNKNYYYYAYSPKFTKNASGTYYLDNNEYKLVNKKVITDTSLYYTKADQWILTKIPESEDGLYQLIITLHRLISTGDSDSRELNNIIGCINRIKDIISNIDTQLMPNRLMWTTSDGVIQTSNTQFPSKNADAARVLTGQGNWENRVRSMRVVSPETSESAWTINTGTIDTHTNNNNIINFKAGNKWIGLNVDTDNDQLIQILHTASAQAAHDFDTDVEIVSALNGTNQTDNKIVLPVLKTDNAGHIIGYSTNTFYIPHNFKSIAVDSDDSDVDSTQTIGTLVADNIVDTWTFAPQNKWIDIAADATNDKITIGHKYSPEQTYRNDTGDTANQTPLFGATFKVPNYETDKAGHIIKSSSHTVQIPKGSYSETANKNVLTSLTFNSTTGKLEGTRVNVGTLPLTEYSAINDVDVLAAADSINTAFAKLSNQINNEIKDRIVSIDYEATIRKNADTELSTNLEKETENREKADENLSDRITSEVATLNETINEKESALNKKIDDEIGILTNNLNTEIQNRTDADTAINEDIKTESETRAAKDNELQSAIAQEIIDREAVAKELADEIDTEKTDRLAADAALQSNIDAEKNEREASDTTLQNNINKEASDRAAGDASTLDSAKSYTDDKITALVDSAPEALNTLKELATALGENENFSTTITEEIGKNAAAIKVEQQNIATHIADESNPHNVTKSQIGLGNVDNESKQMMFTNPEFTGVPKAPTAKSGTSTAQIATTEFVSNEVLTLKKDITATKAFVGESVDKSKEEIIGIITATKEDAIKNYATKEEIKGYVNKEEVQGMLQSAFADLLENYNITLIAPSIEVMQSEDGLTLTVQLLNENENDSYSIIWYKKQLDAEPEVVSESVQMTAETSGEYYCEVTRVHGSHTAMITSEIYTITIE